MTCFINIKTCKYHKAFLFYFFLILHKFWLLSIIQVRILLTIILKNILSKNHMKTHFKITESETFSYFNKKYFPFYYLISLLRNRNLVPSYFELSWVQFSTSKAIFNSQKQGMHCYLQPQLQLQRNILCSSHCNCFPAAVPRHKGLHLRFSHQHHGHRETLWTHAH